MSELPRFDVKCSEIEAMADESSSKSAEVVTKIRVGMTCGGCAGSVSRILNKIEGTWTCFALQQLLS